jgi:16S rRNA (guanine(1405)-N(7))-methyltransferase
MPPHPDLPKLRRAVHQSRKYRRVCTPLVERLGNDELHKRPQFKAAVKATKNKLHQVAGAYLNAPPPYADWLRTLETLPTNAPPTNDPRPHLQEMMQAHASTRERLPILDIFYTTMLAGVGPVHSVLDVACGLNPLAVPWMPLQPDTTYTAIDIYTDMMGFIDAALETFGVQGTGIAHDVGRWLPPDPVDVALVLKALPCLDQSETGLAADVLERLPAQWAVVSYPVASLGGRNRGMVPQYRAQFLELVPPRWEVVRTEQFTTELAFLLRAKSPPPP